MINKLITVMATNALLASSVSALTFSNFAASDVLGSDSDPIADGSAAFLIADGGDGFDFDPTAVGATYSVDSTIGSTNDFIFASNSAQNFSTLSLISGNANFTNTAPETASGFGFALLFFDGVTSTSFTTGGGENYGFYQGADWQIPSNDSGTFSFGTDFEQFSSAIGPNGSVVPEPSTFALIAGCFGLAVAMVRRRV